MAEYVCESQGHRHFYATPPAPTQRCQHDQSALVPAGGSALPAPRRPVPGPRPVRRLRIAFDDTVVTVAAGEQVMLGRDPEYSPYAERLGRLGRHDNVSRRHAEVGLDADGRAWIRDWYSTNLTRVDTEPLPPGRGRDLRDGQTVRLCRTVAGTVELLREDPDA